MGNRQRGGQTAFPSKLGLYGATKQIPSIMGQRLVHELIFERDAALGFRLDVLATDRTELLVKADRSPYCEFYTGRGPTLLNETEHIPTSHSVEIPAKAGIQ